VTVDVIMHHLEAVCRHMSEVLISTSYSTIFYEARDFSTALFDREGRLISQEIGCPVHLAAMPFAVKVVYEDFKDNLQPDDTILMNDPYRGGSHIGDYTFVTPVFRKKELIGFATTRAHVIDSGQAAPTFFAEATEVVQEGLRIPPVKLYSRGKPVADVLKLVLSHTRLPRWLAGDIRASVASNTIGKKELLRVYDRYGEATVQESVRAILDYAERMVRKGISTIPTGTYEADDQLDTDTVTTDPYKLHAKITVEKESVTVDWTGTDPPAKGPINRPRHATMGDTFYGLKCILDPNGPANAGSFRPINVVVPDNCLLSAKWPSPVDRGNNETSARIVDTVWQALAPAIPERVIAMTYGYAGGASCGGIDPRSGEPYAFWEGPPGGWGGRHNKDGINANWHLHGNVRDTPIEIMELVYPVMITRSELRIDSGGPGKFRGGLGLSREYKFVNHSATAGVGGDRARAGPPGLFGGKRGALFRGVLIREDGREEVVAGLNENGEWYPSFRTLWNLPPNSAIRLEEAGGGGYGNPLERNPELVLKDVTEGYVTPESAVREYGVVIEPEGTRINYEATEAERKKRTK
jgi:N-methylhydantoinase B